MVKQLNLKILGAFALFLIAIVIGCSKDDGDSGQQQQQGGNIFRYQAVTVEFGNMDLGAAEYSGTLAGQNVKVMRIDSHHLCFSVPMDAELGPAELSIPSLGKTISYNIQQPVLPQSPDQTIGQLISLGDAQLANLESVEPNNNYQRFKEFYANHATAQQKEQMAQCYFVNKSAFDALIAFNPENPGGKFDASHAQRIGKFLAAVGAGGASVWIMYSQIPADPPGAILAAGAVYFFYKKAKSLGEEVIQQSDTRTIGFKLGGVGSMEDKGLASNGVSLTNDVAVTLPFNLRTRALTNADRSTNSETVSGFFEKLDFINDFVAKTNTAITWVNNNIPLVNFSTMNSISMQSNPPAVDTSVSAQSAQNISFSISDPNVQLVQATLSDNGQMSLRVKVIGNPSQWPVASALNYNYTDELSSLQGHFDIEIQSQNNVSLIGNWAIAGTGQGDFNFETGIFPTYGNGFSESGICTGLQQYTREVSTAYSFNSVSITATSLALGYSRLVSGQFCDAAYGEAQCSYTDSYTYSGALSLAPSMQPNSTIYIASNLSHQSDMSCSAWVDVFDICTPPSCETTTSSDLTNSSSTITIKMLDDPNTIYVDVNDVNQLKLVRQ